jgi:hypothetical protein
MKEGRAAQPLSGKKKAFHHLGELVVDWKWQTSNRKAVAQKTQFYLTGLSVGRRGVLITHIPALFRTTLENLPAPDGPSQEEKLVLKHPETIPFTASTAIQHSIQTIRRQRHRERSSVSASWQRKKSRIHIKFIFFYLVYLFLFLIFIFILGPFSTFLSFPIFSLSFLPFLFFFPLFLSSAFPPPFPLPIFPRPCFLHTHNSLNSWLYKLYMLPPSFCSPWW